jgi:hypothetical protein
LAFLNGDKQRRIWVDEGQKVGGRLSFMVSGAIEEEEGKEEEENNDDDDDDDEEKEEEDYTSLRR